MAMSASFEAILGVVTVSAVIISYFSGVWGIYGHFLTVGKIEPGMKLVSLLSIFGMIWFLATRWAAGTLSQSADPGRDLVALALLAIFTILFWWAIRTTRQKRLSLAFSKDEPEFIHTTGPYAWIRHPFYTAYIIFWIATAVAAATLWFWVMPIIMTVLYLRAISIEERKFSASPVSSAYRAYKARTGMLFPTALAHQERATGL
jgi:protein-S-isoprenylcysteine O-methyltransferase Ste14